MISYITNGPIQFSSKKQVGIEQSLGGEIKFLRFPRHITRQHFDMCGPTRSARTWVHAAADDDEMDEWMDGGGGGETKKGRRGKL